MSKTKTNVSTAILKEAKRLKKEFEKTGTYWSIEDCIEAVKASSFKG